jgi:superfamily II DNA or RNA helicase
LNTPKNLNNQDMQGGNNTMLRNYQSEAVEAILEDWRVLERPLIFIATGGGKTIVMAEAIKRVLAEQAAARFLVVAHTREIILQIYNTIRQHVDLGMGEIGMEMGELKAYPYAKVVVATRQSLSKQRLARVTSPAFTHLLIDEAHHAAPDNQYWKIFSALRDANPTLKVAGFTATPKRTDKKGFAIFTKIGYRWSILAGIEEGYLVNPVRYQVEADNVVLTDLRVRQGDYEIEGLNKSLKAANWQAVALAAWKRYGEGRKTLAFFSSVELSKAFAALAHEQGIAAAHIDGTTPVAEREAILGRLKRGDLKIVSNVAVLTEGFDEPTVSCILWARPTLSEVVLTQAIGRGLRPAEGKSECLVLDLTPVDTRLLTTGSLLGLTERCFSCGVTFLKGFAKCPKCGAQIYTGVVQRALPADDLGQKSKLLTGGKKDVDGIEVRSRPKAVFEGDADSGFHAFFKYARIDQYFAEAQIKGYAAALQSEWLFILDPIEQWNPNLLEKAKAALDSQLPLTRQAAERIVSLSGGYRAIAYRYEGETAELVWLEHYPHIEQALDAYRKALIPAGRAARQARWWQDPATPKQHGFLRGLQKQYGLTLKVQLRYKGELSEAVNLVKGFGSLCNILQILSRRLSS